MIHLRLPLERADLIHEVVRCPFGENKLSAVRLTDEVYMYTMIKIIKDRIEELKSGG